MTDPGIKPTIVVRIQNEIMRRLENGMSEPIGIIMHPKTYTEFISDEVGIGNMELPMVQPRIYGTPIFISHKLRDLQFIYQDDFI